MRAVGLTCGVGSLLIGARSAGFKIVGNIEWRKYYHTGTFEHNFPGAWMVRRIEDLSKDQVESLQGIDLAMGHPNCGNHSNLRTSKPKLDDPGDLPLFLDLVNRIKPRFFVMDNLPKSFLAMPMSRYAENLPEYDLFPEWVSNYHYGNTQFFRRRFFLIGALRSEGFTFVPEEFDHDRTLRDVIGDLPIDRDISELGHVHQNPDRTITRGWAAHQFGLVRPGNKITLREFQDQIRDFPEHRIFEYTNLKGERKSRPGYMKVTLDHYSLVQTGGGAALDNHYRADTLAPLTIRERARIQGCPDDFVFLPLNFLDDIKTYDCVYKQIGKFMPVEFATFVSKQIAARINGEPFQATGKRLVKRNEHIDAAKIWYCTNVGYGDRKEQACDSCWIRPCSLCKSHREEPVLDPEIKLPRPEHRKRETLSKRPEEPKIYSTEFKTYDNF